MKKGYSFFSFDHNVDLKKAISLIADADYDGVELVFHKEGKLTFDTPDKELLNLKDFIHGEGLEIHSVGASFLWDYNFVSNDEAIKKKSLENAKTLIQKAAILGVHHILFIPGYVGAGFLPNAEHVRYDCAYDRCISGLQELSQTAKECKVCICVENVWNQFLLSPLEMRLMLNLVDSPYVGMYLDVGNIKYIADPCDWIEILQGYIKKVHVCDFRSDVVSLSGFVDLFAGDLAFDNIIKSLKGIGYKDYLTLEMLPNYKKDPYLSISSNAPAMEKLVTMARD